MNTVVMRMLYPRRCVLCHCYLGIRGAAMLCDACAIRVRQQYRVFDYFTVAGTDGVVAALWYQGAVRTALRRYKFHQGTMYATWFAAQLVVAISPWLSEWKPDCITYVPLGPKRFWERGYNQSEMIARKIAKTFGLPCSPLLSKRLFISRQSSKNAEMRLQNAQNAFISRDCSKIMGKRILIIDDIITTGATVAACAAVLRAAGAECVFAAAIAKTT